MNDSRKPGVIVLLSARPSPRYIRAGIGPGREGKPIEVRAPDPPWNPRPYLGSALPKGNPRG